MFEKLFSFGRMPINKETFFKIMDHLIEADDDFLDFFIHQPRLFDKIYVSLSERELTRVAIRRGSPDIVEAFEEYDALFAYDARCIIIYAPSMLKKLSDIPRHSYDSQGHILFTIHFFACLFHELGHAHEYSRKMGRYQAEVLNAYIAGSTPPEPLVIEASEEYAEQTEKHVLDVLSKFLGANGIGWDGLAEHLFDWDKFDQILLKLNKTA